MKSANPTMRTVAGSYRRFVGFLALSPKSVYTSDSSCRRVGDLDERNRIVHMNRWNWNLRPSSLAAVSY